MLRLVAGTRTLPHRQTVFLGTLLSASLLGLWQMATAALGSSLVPGPVDVAVLFAASAVDNAVIRAQDGGTTGFRPHVAATLLHVISGCVVGIGAGVLTALVADESRLTSRLFDSVIELARVIPPLILVPFAALLFDSPRVAAAGSVALYVALQVAMYTQERVRYDARQFVEMGRMLGAGRWRLALSVKLPAVVTGLIGPLRVAVSLGLGIVVVAEYLIVPAGIGRVMRYAVSYGRVDLILVGVLWTVTIVAVFDLFLAQFDRTMLVWSTRYTDHGARERT